MKRECFHVTRSLVRFLLLLIPLLLFSPPLWCQVLSDAQLSQNAQLTYTKGDYISASIYLFAYMQKHPELAAQLQENYDFSVAEVRRAWTERDRLQAQLNAESHNGVSSSTSGLHAAPPPLKIPKEPLNVGVVAGQVAEVHPPLHAIISGVWKFRMHSTVSNNNYEGTLDLSDQGSFFAGRISAGAASGAVKGTFSDGTLELSRDTGAATIQHYRLVIKGNFMTGTFWNTGKYADSGTVALER